MSPEFEKFITIVITSLLIWLWAYSVIYVAAIGYIFYRAHKEEKEMKK